MEVPAVRRAIRLGLLTIAVMAAPAAFLLMSAEPAPAPVVEVVSDESAPPVVPDPASAGVELVDVAVPREFRGLWVATVSNLDFPSRQGLSASALRTELQRLVEKTHGLGFNALVFQVRPEGDALYSSRLEPWSRFLSGRQGKDPGFDPLDYLVTEAHSVGMEVHAWFNPYRAASNKSATNDDLHITRTWAKSHTRPWGRVLWLDPGVPEVQNHALKVVLDVVDRYDIDGVHLDDYFYPYPEGRQTFPDDASYKVYQNGGGRLERAAWRRSNVDNLVEALATKTREKRPEVRFGISPFGIYRPGIPAGIRGLDQVSTLNADPLKWFENGWVDYLAPQLYWPTGQKGQEYGLLLDWWNDQSTLERPLLVGLDLTKVGKDPKWTLAELRSQVRLSRSHDRTAGQIWFRATPVLANQAGLGDLMAEIYHEPALPPRLPRLQDLPVVPPHVRRDPRGLELDHPDRKYLRGLVLYRSIDDVWKVDRILGPRTDRLVLGPGSWALSAVTRTGTESKGVKIVIADDGDAVSEAPAGR